MHLEDWMFRKPDHINDAIRSAASGMASSEPVIVPIVGKGQPGNPYDNARKRRGKRVFGYSIQHVPAIAVAFRGHSIVDRDGRLLDPTLDAIEHKRNSAFLMADAPPDSRTIREFLAQKTVVFLVEHPLIPKYHFLQKRIEDATIDGGDAVNALATEASAVMEQIYRDVHRLA